MQKVVLLNDFGELSFVTKLTLFGLKGKSYFVYASPDKIHYYKILPHKADDIEYLSSFKDHFDTCADYGINFVAGKDFDPSKDSYKIKYYINNMYRSDPDLLKAVETCNDGSVTIIQVPNNAKWKIYCYIGDYEEMIERVETPHGYFDENGEYFDEGYGFEPEYKDEKETLNDLIYSPFKMLFDIVKNNGV